MKQSLLVRRLRGFLPALPALLAAMAPGVRADVKLPAIFGDHMVLQRDGAVPVWGSAAPGEAVTVAAGAAKGAAVAGADGKWTVKLSGLAASSRPLDLTVSGKNTVVFHDVLVGDVWVCAGQSNMEFGIDTDASAPEEIAKAAHPEIRLFVVPHGLLPAAAAEFGPARPGTTEGQWLVCSPETVARNGYPGMPGFSAVGYFFGRDVAAFTHQPVGLILDCWGGTPAQAWTSLEGLQAVPALKEYADESLRHRDKSAEESEEFRAVVVPRWKAEVEQWKAAHPEAWAAYQAEVEKYAAAAKAGQPAPRPRDPTPRGPRNPASDKFVSSVLYNAMIAPLVPYGIKGVIWYQGEANVQEPFDRPVEYATLLPAMIADWRSRWNRGDFPFLIVQLANFKRKDAEPAESDRAALRESQAKTAALPGNGLATAIDLGEANTIHPTDKDDVGARLALVARKAAYGDAAVAAFGPAFAGATAEGATLRVAFDHAEGGLVIGAPPAHWHLGQPRPPSSALKGFAVAGADGKYVWADARIDGGAVVVSSPKVASPVSVRYDWGENPDGNLYNKEGLPAFPFRTDTLPVGELAAPATPAAAPAGE